ncbi:MAG: hypothetical protein OXE42_02450 [Gammaproteobacteria bacterium]|nr:hypothetical protein [Gammaproteobacteria bacterium]
MKLLLDESIPRRLKFDLSAFDVKTVPEIGWAGKRNGDLLQLASGEFNLFITVDKNLQHQQTIENYDIAVVVLDAVSNKYEELTKLIPSLINKIHNLEKGRIHTLSI